MSNSVAVISEINFHRFRSPKTVIGRFVARRTVRSAILWGVVFGIYVASKAIGFVDLYPTAAARAKIAETFSNNIGIELILGKAPHSASTAAYVAWNTANVMVVIGAIWALLLATKYLRGEEDTGRAEVLLSGQTTPRRGTVNTLLGLFTSLIALFVVCAVLFSAIGKSHGVDFNGNASIYFAFVVSLGVGLFFVIGALASQLFPTRSRAAGVSGAVLGIFFLIKAIGDVTSAHWLLNLDPLGWIENLQPLAKPDPVWLIPFLVTIAVGVTVTIFYAGKRDLGESIISDKAISKAHFRSVRSPFALAQRLTRGNSIGWLFGLFIMAILFGLITKSTAQIFSASESFEKTINQITQHARLSSALAFLGVIYLIQMMIIMALAASNMSAIRREEANGYIDNFLVRPFSRIRWLIGRINITLIILILAGFITTLGVWLGIFNQHIGISFNTLLLAGFNALVPAILVVGVGIFTFGIAPRLTSFMAYAVLAWSILIELVSSGLNINHWVLDTSVIHQISLSPSVNPNWSVNLIILGISVVLGLIGLLRFNYRDIEGE